MLVMFLTDIDACYYLRLYHPVFLSVSNFFCPYYNHFVPQSLQYPLYTVMVFDDRKNGIPVAFFVISRTREQDLRPVLQELHHRVERINSDFNPSSIIVDNA